MKGVAASEGCAVGQALVYAIDEAVDSAPASDPEGELARFHSALEQAAESLRQVRAHAPQPIGEAQTQGFDPPPPMLQDPPRTPPSWLAPWVFRRSSASATSPSACGPAIACCWMAPAAK